MNNNLPTSEALDQSIERVEQRLLQKIRGRRKLTRTARIGFGVLAGVILFSGGVAVGGAAFASPSAHPPKSPHAALLTVACHTSSSSSSTSSLLQFSVPGVVDDVREDPAATCSTIKSATDENRALNSGVKTLLARGITCGYIDIEGLSIYYFNGNGLTSDLAEVSVPADCNTSISVTVPTTERQLVACAVNSKRAEVYPNVTPTESAAAFCASLHQKIWRP